MPKYIVIFIILFCFTRISLCQSTKIDSLLNILKHSKEDTNKVNILNDLSEKLINRGNHDSARKYAIDAQTIAQKTDFKKGIANALNNIGSTYYRQGNYEEALRNFLMYLKILQETGDQRGIADCYNNLGLIYEDQGNYQVAMKYFLLALKIYESGYAPGEVANRIANIYINIGVIFTYQTNYSEALKIYFQALNILEQIGNKKSIAYCYTEIGNIHYYQGNYDSSLKNQLRALQIKEEMGDRVGLAINYNNIGSIYENKANYSMALKNYFLALKIWNESRDLNNIATANLNIGNVFTKQKKFNEAKKYLLNSLQLAKVLGANDLLKDCYDGLAELAAASRDYKNAYQYQKLYSEIKDSLISESNTKAIAEMKTKYETEKKDKELQQKYSELQLANKNKEIQAVRIGKQRAAIKYLIGGFTLLIIFVLVYFRLYNQKRKTIFRHQLLETELKALRSQMNPHFTFNVLSSIQYYIGTNNIEAAELYLNKFSTLIRMILNQSKNAYLPLEQEIVMLKLYLELEEMRFEKKFNYSIQVEENLDQTKILIPGMLIQPIVENAIKHGIEHKKGNAVVDISFAYRNSAILCTVTDNGIGRAAARKVQKESKSASDSHLPPFSLSHFHSSSAISIIKERIDTLSKLYNINLAYNTEDLFDKEGQPCGTRVSMEIPIKV